MTAPEQFTAAFWDERYGSSEKIWSGEPNAVLVQEVADLAPGTALDVGSGEGGDAIWLAARGWTVTAIDVSRVGLERVAARAAAEGLGERVATALVDVFADPIPGPQDLVTAHFLQLPADVRPRILSALAGAVAPGGRLLLVGHDPEGMPEEFAGHHPPEMFATADQLVAELAEALDGWTIEVAERRARTGVQPDGRPGFPYDAVLRARRPL
ncbi:methyltransferase domain-containing protein [Actinomycetospora lutea]|uniref:SAM-dependent methyltransferase n=1 Tax=Actinomycetospora lutea TaxID=663604 RepID=UPI0023655FD4|nr:methyltransferase domain-containing protein [Actinomycetospora lutea]MDD7938811.1 methyltransferase domain-containing protein [Actinomycetospora lutea]